MVDFKIVNNKRHIDIMIAALCHVSYGSNLIKWIIRIVLKRWSKQCDLGIDKKWVKDCSNLISR